MRTIVVSAIACAVATGAPAMAQVDWLSEVRLGVVAHDLDLLGDGSGGTESGVNIQAEIVLESPKALSWAFSPRPWGQFSVNTDGDTNYGGIGLAWTTPRERRIFGEVDFGVVIHDGVINVPPISDNPDEIAKRIRLAETRVLFGSRELFRTALGLGVRVTDTIDAQLVIEHLSHGQVFADGKNEGLDTIGVRFGYRLQ